MFEFAIPIQPTVTNNQAEYEALLRGLQYLREAGAVSVEVYGDSRARRPDGEPGAPTVAFIGLAR
jgi:ribonuclease HI